MTKEELLKEYTFDFGIAEQIKTQLFEEINSMMPLSPDHEKKLRALFDKNVEEGKQSVLAFMRQELNEEELLYLLEAARHPTNHKMRALLPKTMEGFFSKIQESTAMFEDLVKDPKKIEELPS